MTLIARSRTPNPRTLRTALCVALVAALVTAVGSAAALGLGLEIGRRLCLRLWPRWPAAEVFGAATADDLAAQWAGEGES